MPQTGGAKYERFDAGDDDPRKSYRTIAEIRAEQAEQRAEQTMIRAEVAKVGKAVDGVATGQAEIMVFLKGDFNTPGLKNIVQQHGNSIENHTERINAIEKTLTDSREEVRPIVEAHKSRKRDWGSFKGGLLGAAAGWVVAKFTGGTP